MAFHFRACVLRPLLAPLPALLSALLLAAAPARAADGCGDLDGEDRPGRVITAGPHDYLGKLPLLQPGDTLLLAAGDYGLRPDGSDSEDPPGLPVLHLHGTAEAPITLRGPAGAARAVLWGRATHDTVRLADASHVVLCHLDIDGRDLGGAGVATRGPTHHVTLQQLRIRGVGHSQQTVGIRANSTPTWGWVIRGNEIAGAGTGIYLGNSDGAAPFVAGLVEYNVVRDTIGYNLQVKHQAPWVAVPEGMPTGPTTTVIRHNVFSKLGRFVSPDGARPNLLVGDQPPHGPGADNGFAIYGNFFWQNPTENLFQGEGRIAFYANVLVNDHGGAVLVRPHNGAVREVRILGNTILARDDGIVLKGGAPGTVQRVEGNAVWAATPLSLRGAGAAHNLAGARAAAAQALAQPDAPLGRFDPRPRPNAAGPRLQEPLDLGPWALQPDGHLDFDGALRSGTRAGAFDAPDEDGEDAPAGWLPALAPKPPPRHGG